MFNLNECLKKSALSKTIALDNSVQNVTIGPNTTIHETTETDGPSFKETSRSNEQTDHAEKEEGNNTDRSTKLYVEVEATRHVQVQKMMEHRMQLMKLEEDKIKRWFDEQKRNAVLSLSLDTEKLEKLLDSEMEIHRKLKLDEQLSQEQDLLHLERQKQMQLAEEKKKQAEAQSVLIYEKLKQSSKLFAEKHTEGIELMRKFSDVLGNQNANKIEQCRQVLEILKQKNEEICKLNINELNPSVYEDALKILKKLTEFNQSITSEIEKEKNKKRAQEQIEKEQNERKEAEKQIQIESNQSGEKPNESMPSERPKEPAAGFKEIVSESSIREFATAMTFLQQYRESYKGLLVNEQYKQYRFDCQKAINIPVNAISATSGHHLQDKYNRLIRFLSGNPVELSRSKVSITQHPEAKAFCLDLLAQKLVKQGDLTVSSHPEAAFAFAAVAISIWNKFPEFGRLLLAHFYEDCVYLIPMYPAQLEGMSDSDYYSCHCGINKIDSNDIDSTILDIEWCLCYRFNESNEVEKQDKFLKRMSGIVRLYCAILVTKQRMSERQLPHPHGLRNGWRWLSCVLNLQPSVDITATILLTFLEVAGLSMLMVYNKQFMRVIMYIYRVFFPQLKKIDSGGPVTRLEVLLENILKTGRIPAPKGVLPDNFW